MHPANTKALAEGGELLCEQHPDKTWPHDDCAGPGMPKDHVPWQPTLAESEAAELVLAEAMGEQADMFWRAVVEAQLIAAHDAFKEIPSFDGTVEPF